MPHNRRRSEYTITLKAGQAASGGVTPVAPFDLSPDLWSRLMMTYASTHVLRDSLVHRRLIMDPVTGDINGLPRPGEPASTALTIAEQSAFCRVAAGAAQAVIDPHDRSTGC